MSNIQTAPYFWKSSKPRSQDGGVGIWVLKSERLHIWMDNQALWEKPLSVYVICCKTKVFRLLIDTAGEGGAEMFLQNKEQ